MDGSQTTRIGMQRLISRREMFRASLATTLGVAAAASGAGLRFGERPSSLVAASMNPSNNTVVTQWNDAALQAVRASTLGPPMVARALAIVHMCIYDAWTPFDPVAVPTRSNGIPKVANQRGVPFRAQAVSFAAY